VGVVSGERSYQDDPAISACACGTVTGDFVTAVKVLRGGGCFFFFFTRTAHEWKKNTARAMLLRYFAIAKMKKTA
jgi:hypothetical protein